MLLLPRLSQVNSNRSVDICSELKFYFLLDCWDVWELGLKLVFRGLDPPLVFLTCVFSLALWILVVCMMFVFRKYSWFMQEIVLFNIHSIHAFFKWGRITVFASKRVTALIKLFQQASALFYDADFFCCCCVKEAMDSMCFTVKPHCTITSRKRPLIQNTQIFLVKAFLVI